MQITVPPGMMTQFKGRNSRQNALTSVRLLQFMCHSTSLPGLVLSSRPILRYGYGAAEKKPFAPVMNDLIMTVYNDGQNNNLQFFHDWMRLVCRNDFIPSIGQTVSLNGKPSYPYELAYQEEYAVDVTIRLYNNNGRPKYEVILRNAWPMMMPDVNLDWQPVQQFMSFPVVLSYADWDINRSVFDDDDAELTGITGGIRGPGQPLGNIDANP